MLTAVVSSFYSQHMGAGSVDPRQLRMARLFVKSPSRHLCAFSLPVSQICRKVYINSPETISLSFLKPLCKTAFCHNASTGHDGNQAPVPRGCWPRGCTALGLLHGAAPSARGTGHSPQQPLRLQREGRADGLDGKVGASVRGATPRPPTLPLFPCSAPSVSPHHLPFSAWAMSRLGWARLFRVLYACTSATALLQFSSNEYDKHRYPLGFANCYEMGSVGEQHPVLTGSPLTPPSRGPCSSSTSAILVEPRPWQWGRQRLCMEQGTAKDKKGDVSLGGRGFQRVVLGVACYWQRFTESTWDSWFFLFLSHQVWGLSKWINYKWQRKEPGEGSGCHDAHPECFWLQLCSIYTNKWKYKAVFVQKILKSCSVRKLFS